MTLTVQFYEAVRLAQRILGHTSIIPEIIRSHVADLQLHVLYVAVAGRDRLVLVPGTRGV